MGKGLNKATLIGHLGGDPESRQTGSGQTATELRVATNDSYTDKTGRVVERTEWHRIVVWGKAAEACAKYLHKGSHVYVEGRIQTREWEDKEGRKRWTTEIVANDVKFLDSKGGGSGSSSSSGPRTTYDAPPPPVDDLGELPF